MATGYKADNDETIAHARPAALVRISWGSVFAGTSVGLASLTALTVLGISIGFGVVDPTVSEKPLFGVGTGSAVWAVAIMVASLFVAGFVAARMSGQPKTSTAVMHGVTVWSVVTIVIIWLAATTVGGLIGGAVETVSSSTSSMKTAIRQVARRAEKQILEIDFSQPVPDQLPPEIENRLEARGWTAANFSAEFGQAIAQSALGQEDLRQLGQNALETAREIVQNPTNYESIIADFVDNLTGSGTDGVLSEAERTQITDRLVNRTGITRAEAEASIKTAEATVMQVRQNVVQAFEQAKTQLVQATEAALNTLTKVAFWSFAGLLLALVAAAGGAAAGSPNHLPRTRV